VSSLDTLQVRARLPLNTRRHENNTSVSDRSRQRTDSPRVLSAPFHALTCAREAWLVCTPFYHHQAPPPQLRCRQYNRVTTTTITISTPPPHHYHHHAIPSISNTSSTTELLPPAHYHHYWHRRPDVAAVRTWLSSLSLSLSFSLSRPLFRSSMVGHRHAGKDPMIESDGVGVRRWRWRRWLW